MTKHFIAAFVATLAFACVDSGVEDESMYLTGTEEHAVQTEDGEYACESPKKTLICHIPPGNPDNAHTICVGTAAVKAHERNHGDPIGPCDETGDEPDGEPDGDGGDGDEGDVDGGPSDTPDDGTPDDGGDEDIDAGTPVPTEIE